MLANGWTRAWAVPSGVQVVSGDEVVSHHVFHRHKLPSCTPKCLSKADTTCWFDTQSLPAFNVSDEIAYELDPLGVVIRNLQTIESVFQGDHQLKMVQPVGPKIIEIRSICDTFDIHVQMLGNESPHLGGVAILSRRWLSNG